MDILFPDSITVNVTMNTLCIYLVHIYALLDIHLEVELMGSRIQLCLTSVDADKQCSKMIL